MTDDDAQRASDWFDKIDPELATDVLRDIFRSMIEHGSVDVGDRPADEVIDDFWHLMADLRRGATDYETPKWSSTVDFRKSLRERAAVAAAEDDQWIAVTLYATWLEHFINGLLVTTLGRQGLSERTVKALIRKLDLITKATALWEIAELPPLSEEQLKVVEMTTNLRNTFVHYKWSGADSEERHRLDKDLALTISDVHRLGDALLDIWSTALWDGRRDELLQAFRSRTLPFFQKDTQHG
jgi:hypothetical protein